MTQLRKHIGIFILILFSSYQAHAQVKVVKGKGVYQGTFNADFDSDGKKDWIKIYETSHNNLGEVYCSSLSKTINIAFISPVGKEVWSTIGFDDPARFFDRICLRILIFGINPNEDYESSYTITIKYSKELNDFILDELYFDDGKSKVNVKKYGKPLGLIRVNDIQEETFRKSVIEEWDNDNKGYVTVKRPKFLPFRE